MPESNPFDRRALEAAFQRVGEIAAKEGKLIEISVYGGSAMVLTMDFRVSTRDVDAVFEADRSFVRKAIRIVAEEFGWTEDWLNDGVKGFLSERDSHSESKALFRSYPREAGPGLRVFVATPAYLFAMKSVAMRAGGIGHSQDIEDIRQLGALLGVESPEDAISIVSRYYPSDRIAPKTRFGLEEIFGAPRRAN
jgi:hypothetical protein